MTYTLHQGDCLEVLRTLPDASVDAIVTDPPYGLSFMGKRWDYDVPAVEVWAECLRVLKPGGHLLAFAGTRTQHRMAVRIEDAGFEIRDMLAWVYGSGFPKSLDVSKAIDQGQGESRERQLRFTAWMRSTGITASQINEATRSGMGSHYLTAGSQPQIATAEMMDAMRHLLPEVPEEIERLVAERTGIEWAAYVNREVVGRRTMPDTSSVRIACATSAQGIEKTTRREIAITAPATDAARQWSGWGTALKPALEPITLARKPLDGTVAENVLAHGTGALNVDGCRVEIYGAAGCWGAKQSASLGYGGGTELSGFATQQHPSGRWPANLIHDGSEEVVGLFPGDEDGGSAARFFYCAKASKQDRDEGLDGFALKQNEDWPQSMDGQDTRGAAARRNHHPTVKPTDLMRYLCRLVTPPGGVVLDPFTGSGSTGRGAILEGFRFIGIEREPEYVAIARARIEDAVGTRRAQTAQGELGL